MHIESVSCIDDLRRAALARIPRFAYTFLAGGAGNDAGVRRNEQELARLLFAPVGMATGRVDTSVRLFGRTYAQPFGFAPVGMANLAWAGCDLMLAETAQRESLPYVISTAASTELEELAARAPDNCWFQLYMLRDDELNFALLDRVAAAGIEVLAVTVDTPVRSRRNGSIRERFEQPFQPHPRFVLDVARHPRWALRTARAGMPNLMNYSRYVEGGDIHKVAAFMKAQSRGGVSWDDIAMLRRRWKGPLVVKGILDAADATRAAREGADAVWVSNHGGRQLESAPATISVLPAVREAVGTLPVLFDSGVRGGEDIVKAGALGATMAFCGRAPIFGAAAFGAAGVAKAHAVLADEVRTTLAQIGCRRFADLSPAFIHRGEPGQGERGRAAPAARAA
ncbi:alpha-hydroxy acid oxidase [Pigmentiphaga kullae]|uniref:L-lactate dehydrogenase (Cytochrome)/(S)-mandelate dehydrogenase n=1 Tax=Pigmentiphaga kullae TaxID=151784 RepID=A0A4Q7N6L4_9BURK|nr:alpha-hydroxy acid oxidase [Pigmentiphaga kullae]RZS76977.1 L-lactate dehydrogenase (cytochrome)/(S)-mandelate dehydrogenase [Pigmentiphaga kullae]